MPKDYSGHSQATAESLRHVKKELEAWTPVGSVETPPHDLMEEMYCEKGFLPAGYSTIVKAKWSRKGLGFLATGRCALINSCRQDAMSQGLTPKKKKV